MAENSDRPTLRVVRTIPTPPPPLERRERSLARDRASAFYDQVLEGLVAGQVIMADGTVTDTDGQTAVGNLGDMLASYAIEGDSSFNNVPLDTLQAMARAAFQFGVEAPDVSLVTGVKES